MNLNIVKCHPEAKEPTYATEGSACFDFYAIEDGHLGTLNSTKTFRTGLKFEIPKGFGMMIFSRSGMGFKNDIRLANCVGIIDSDYRDEVMIKLTADKMVPYDVHAGDRIAQGWVVPICRVGFNVTDTILSTDRVGGFGSTGK